MITEKKNRKGTVYYEDEDCGIFAKICTKCNEIKTLDNFTKHKAGLGGRESACKDCKSCYYADNKESYVERYESNKEHLLEMMRKRYEENKESYAEYARKHYEENPEYYLRYREKHKEYYAEYGRYYREEHREQINESRREKYETNREREIARVSKWQRENPEKAVMLQQRRRARKKSLPNDFTAEQTAETLSHFGGCALTGGSTDIHWDHVIPLAAGHGGTTYGNMIPLRSDLNLSKSDANIFEWFDANKERFNLSQGKFESLIEWLAEANGKTTEEYRTYVYECFDNSNEVGNYSNDQTA
jgi:hypothetical protein